MCDCACLCWTKLLCKHGTGGRHGCEIGRSTKLLLSRASTDFKISLLAKSRWVEGVLGTASVAGVTLEPEAIACWEVAVGIVSILSVSVHLPLDIGCSIDTLHLEVVESIGEEIGWLVEEDVVCVVRGCRDNLRDTYDLLGNANTTIGTEGTGADLDLEPGFVLSGLLEVELNMTPWPVLIVG